MSLIGEFIGKPNNTQIKSNNNININSISAPAHPSLEQKSLVISTYTDAIESASYYRISKGFPYTQGNHPSETIIYFS